MASNQEKKTTEKEVSYWDEKVKLMVPRDLSNPKIADAVIIHNGHTYQIKRGEEVLVPRKVYQAYMDSEAQKARGLDFANSVQKAE